MCIVRAAQIGQGQDRKSTTPARQSCYQVKNGLHGHWCAKIEVSGSILLGALLRGISKDAIDLDDLRARLSKMTDAELIAFGKAARFMCSPGANMGKPPREPFVIQLREARVGWRRRKA